jgi:hypothetical protein
VLRIVRYFFGNLKTIRRLIIPNGGNDRRTKLPYRMTVLAEGADGSPILAISG